MLSKGLKALGFKFLPFCSRLLFAPPLQAFDGRAIEHGHGAQDAVVLPALSSLAVGRVVFEREMVDGT